MVGISPPWITLRRPSGLVYFVPACGFYEWQKHPGAKTPYYITSADESLLAFAGCGMSGRSPMARG
jgi:hypothetical protein